MNRSKPITRLAGIFLYAFLWPALSIAQSSFPATGKVIELDPGINRILPPETRPEILAEGFTWSEGPLWVSALESLIFSDVPENTIYLWSPKRGLEVYLKPSGYTSSIPRGGETGSNGLILDANGLLVLCQHGDRRVASMISPVTDPAPGFETIADRWEGKRFNSPNDAVFSNTGVLYFTDPAYGLEKRYNDPAREMDFTGVFRVDQDGEVTLITDKLGAPNGIGLSPDEKSLYVANSGGGANSFWMIYDVREDGRVANGRKFYDAAVATDSLRGAPDGLVVRDDGIIFATGPGGVWIFEPSGKPLGIIATGQATSNCTLDDANQYLYMTADMYLMRIRLLY